MLLKDQMSVLNWLRSETGDSISEKNRTEDEAPETYRIS
jgi:hypothetical protein